MEDATCLTYALPASLDESKSAAAARSAPLLGKLQLAAPARDGIFTVASTIEGATVKVFAARDHPSLTDNSPAGSYAHARQDSGDSEAPCFKPRQLPPAHAHLVINLLAAHKHTAFFERAAKSINARVTTTALTTDEFYGKPRVCAKVCALGVRKRKRVTVTVYPRPGFDTLLQGMRLVLANPRFTALQLASYGVTGRCDSSSDEQSSDDEESPEDSAAWGYNGDFVVVCRREHTSLGKPIVHRTRDVINLRAEWVRLSVRLLVSDIAANQNVIVEALREFTAALCAAATAAGVDAIKMGPNPPHPNDPCLERA